jgi:15-cis-phytoene desaturase
MTFAMPKNPGTFTSFEFPPNVPAPFNLAAAILSNNEMLGLVEKIQMVPGLLPMLLEGQDFIDAQDELSVAEFMSKYGMPESVKKEIFIAMGKVRMTTCSNPKYVINQRPLQALDFMDPDKLSMSVILTAMNRFINEADGSQTAFLDGNQPDRLCSPMREYIEKRGGEVRTGVPVREILTGEGGRVEGLSTDGGTVEGDYYVSAMPVDVMKKLLPKAWSGMPFFTQINELEGVPVINIQVRAGKGWGVQSRLVANTNKSHRSGSIGSSLP